MLALPQMHKPVSLLHFNWIHLLYYDFSCNRFQGKKNKHVETMCVLD